MINLRIITPEGVTFASDKVKSISLNTLAGEITVLADHEPLISVLKPGEIEVVTEEGESIDVAASTGILEVRPGSIVNVLADTAERAEHIDIDRAEEAKKRAEEVLQQEENLADIDFAKLQAVIERETARIRVGAKYKDIRNTRPE